MHLIDLSQEIYNGMPVFPGHQKTVIFPAKTHEESDFANQSGFSSCTFGILMGDHCGTHVDAEIHFNSDPKARSIEKMPMECFYGPAICLDVSPISKAKKMINADVLRQTADRSGVSIEAGDIVLLYTGHYDRNGSDFKKYLYDYSGIDRPGMEWLADQGVKSVGIDQPSIDSSEEMKNKVFPAHTVCRERGILNAENLANLNMLTDKRFTVLMLPLKLRGASGSPCRAVALLDE